MIGPTGGRKMRPTDAATTTILGLHWGYIGIMEKKMETILILGLYWGCIGIMENTMETTVILGV